MHDWRVGGWEKLGKSKKGCNQRGRQHLGKGMSDEYWGRPRLAPYSCEPAKKEYFIESVVFFGFPSLSNVLTANISKIHSKILKWQGVSWKNAEKRISRAQSCEDEFSHQGGCPIIVSQTYLPHLCSSGDISKAFCKCEKKNLFLSMCKNKIYPTF